MFLFSCNKKKTSESTEIDLDSNIVLVNIGGVIDRLEVAKILDTLSSFKPKVLGIDFLFSGQKDRVIDSILLSQINKFRNVVFMGSAFSNTGGNRIFFADYLKVSFWPDSLVCSNSYFTKNKSIGFTNFHRLSYYFITRIIYRYSVLKNFATEVVGKYDPEIVKNFDKRKHIHEGICREKDFRRFKKINFGTLDRYPKSTFENKIILIGDIGDVEIGDSNEDKYPYYDKDKNDIELSEIYGLEIQALIVSTILNENYIEPDQKPQLKDLWEHEEFIITKDILFGGKKLIMTL